MRKKHKAVLVEGSIPKHLFSLTWPGIGGSLAITIFNLTDTFFVSRLGTEALAAMGFTFPIVMVVGAISMGISMGAGSVLSRAMGSGDHHLMQRTATDGVLLSILVVGIISLLGLIILDPLFSLMGAEGKVLDLVKDYMFIWFVGAMAVMMPPVSDSCLRATGDMVRPFIVMMICAVMNAVFDPILIFGYLGFPAMGIKGAALATVLARSCGMIATLWFLHFHAGLVDLSKPTFAEVKESWKRILHIGVPAAMTQLLPPVTRGVLTRLAAGAGGAAAVAALAAGTRIESFPAIIMFAYSMALVPMTGQNWGAGKWERINSLRQITLNLSIIYGFIVFVLAFFLAQPAARIFTQEPEVIGYTVVYLRIMSLASFTLFYYSWISQCLNAAGKPFSSLKINLAGSLLFIIPLALVGARLYQFTGLIAGLALGQGLTALFSFLEGRKQLVEPL